MRDSHDAFRAHLAAIVESSDDAIVSEMPDGVITSWNRAAERMFGYAAAEAIGQHIFLIIPDDRRDEEAEVVARLQRGETIDHFETVRRTKDGRLIAISLTVSPIRDSTGRIVGASKVARDVSRRVAAQENLRLVRRELEERVRERAAELASANAVLRAEIAQRRKSDEQRAALFAQLVVAQEDERQRIARELHDQLGQQMTALRLTLETVKALVADRPELHLQLETLQELARQLDQDIAFRVWELTPAVLNDAGLATALTEYAGHWSKRFGIRTEVHIMRTAEAAITRDKETAIYRLMQEALNNIAKHAKADRVDVVLEHSHEYVSLIVEDNGIGFDPSGTPATGGGFGLVGMRERASLSRADFQIESAPGHGTTVILRVPTTHAIIERP